MADKEENLIEQAKKLIENEKRERAEKFYAELDILCKKYNCELTQGQILVIAK